MPFAKMCGILWQNDLRSILHMIHVFCYVLHDQNEFIWKSISKSSLLWLRLHQIFYKFVAFCVLGKKNIFFVQDYKQQTIAFYFD